MSSAFLVFANRPSYMKVSLQNLRSVVAENVAEVKFQRRKPKPGYPAERRMLCTNNISLLNSAKGKYALNYKAPKEAPGYNPTAKNLVVVWDVFMQGYRTINMDSCELISIVPADNNFWNYYTEKLSNMSVQDKMLFMNV